MYIFNINIPNKPLTNIELSTYVQELQIPHFRGINMRDTLPRYPYRVECAIIGTRVVEYILIHIHRTYALYASQMYTCTLYASHMYTICITLHYMHPTCTLYASHMHTICISCVYYMHPSCTL